MLKVDLSNAESNPPSSAARSERPSGFVLAMSHVRLPYIMLLFLQHKRNFNNPDNILQSQYEANYAICTLCWASPWGQRPCTAEASANHLPK